MITVSRAALLPNLSSFTRRACSGLVPVGTG